MSCSWRSLTVVFVGLGLLLCATAPSTGGDPGLKPPLRIRVPDAAGMAVRRALLAARLRLGSARCREVLSDFPSPGPAPPLTDVLERLGRTPEQHLDTLVFEDGSRNRRCMSPAILAFTRPRSGTVYVCARQFQNAVRSDPAYAEMILIHELLHTLGLGENPPTSLAITARVTERCGGASVRRAEGSR
jgi:hypothetical protein